MRILRSAGVLAAVFAASCGYRIVGVGGQLPSGVTRVEVPIFENRTTRSNIGRVLTEDLISRLLGSGKVHVVGSGESQALIQGTVTSYKKEPITFDAKQRPLEMRLTVVVDAALITREDKRLIFEERNVTVRHDYPVKNDLQENDRLEDEALRNAAKLMSQKLVGLMLEGF